MAWLRLCRRPRTLASGVATLTVCLLIPSVLRAQQPGVAALILDLQSGTTLSVEQPETARRPVLPGSFMKIATMAAALESGVITGGSRALCTKTIVVDGHRLTCTHPDLHRPLTPADALTYSCNTYVASVASRIPRAAFDAALAALGLPRSPGVDLRTAAFGLEGARVQPTRLIEAIARIARGDAVTGLKPSTLAVLREGLRGAASRGTAAALGSAGIDALAKTGTVDAGGVSQGLVVGVTPSTHPTRGFALVVSGGAGIDAAGLMAARLSPARAQADARITRPVPTPRSVRVGTADSSGRWRVREMPLDEYVAGVIAGEQAAGSAPAALDALGIAARTYALANDGRHAADGFDLCDLTHCQVVRTPGAQARASAIRTTGRYLADGDRPATIFYTAACGGHSERPSLVWRGAVDPEYLPSRADPACDGQPTWRSEVPARDLLRALRSGGFKGEALRDLRITARTSSGRARWLHLDGLAPSEVSGDDLRTLVGRTLGWQILRSTLFDIARTGGGFAFTGRGAGHGVGLCVIGAAALARRGDDAAQILSRYYPGLRVRALDEVAAPPTGGTTHLRLQVPRDEDADRAGLDRLAHRLLGEVRTALGAPADVNLLLRFHPTVESYERASGARWFTTATTSGTTVDLLPLQVLRQRGLLESTLRHEFAHVLTRDTLGAAPRWMHEGLAEWAAIGSRAAPAARAAAACPSDAAFTRAGSGEALRRVYEQALACYERERAAGRGWRARPAAPD